MNALQKRPVQREDIERSIEHIEHHLQTLGEREVPSRLIGDLVMEELRRLDEVAYVRFASVYRSFQDVTEFQQEIERLQALPSLTDGREQMSLLPAERRSRKKPLKNAQPRVCMADADRSTSTCPTRCSLAANGLYDTTPNPAVGCVLVKDAPRGRHGLDRAGRRAARRDRCAARPPAPRRAARPRTQRSSRAVTRGARAVHEGVARRPGVARVVFAGPRSEPRVNGGGAAELEAAGVAVEGGVMESEAEPLNRGFFTRMRRGVPYVRSKLAVSLDGRTALANGASQWITSAAGACRRASLASPLERRADG